MKMNMPISTLCEGLPNVFADFLRYARDLQFTEEPDLRMWRARFRALYEQQGYHKEVSIAGGPVSGSVDDR